MKEIQTKLPETPLVYLSVIGKDGFELEWTSEGYNYESYRKNERKVSSLNVDYDAQSH
jgi:hypothetical protein